MVALTAANDRWKESLSFIHFLFSHFLILYSVWFSLMDLSYKCFFFFIWICFFPVLADLKKNKNTDTSVASGLIWDGVQFSDTEGREDVKRMLSWKETDDGKTKRGSWRGQKMKREKRGEGRGNAGRNRSEGLMEGRRRWRGCVKGHVAAL